jgi:hypothetical protein
VVAAHDQAADRDRVAIERSLATCQRPEHVRAVARDRTFLDPAALVALALRAAEPRDPVVAARDPAAVDFPVPAVAALDRAVAADNRALPAADVLQPANSTIFSISAVAEADDLQHGLAVAAGECLVARPTTSFTIDRPAHRRGRRLRSVRRSVLAKVAAARRAQAPAISLAVERGPVKAAADNSAPATIRVRRSPAPAATAQVDPVAAATAIGQADLAVVMVVVPGDPATEMAADQDAPVMATVVGPVAQAMVMVAGQVAQAMAIDPADQAIDLVKAAAANNGDRAIVRIVPAAATGPIIAPIASPIAISGTIGGRTIGPTSTTIGVATGTTTTAGSAATGATTIHTGTTTITSTTGAGRRGRR